MLNCLSLVVGDGNWDAAALFFGSFYDLKRKFICFLGGAITENTALLTGP